MDLATTDCRDPLTLVESPCLRVWALFLLGSQGEGDDGLSATASCFHLLVQFAFEAVGIRNHLAGGDLFRRCAVKTKFADAESVRPGLFNADRRTELAAGDGTMSVEVAGSRRGIERRAGFVVGKLVKRSLCSFVVSENSSHRIAREFRAKSAGGFVSTQTYASRSGGISPLKFCESRLKTGCIKLADRERPDTALSASGTTDKPMAGALDGVGKGSIDNLD